MSDNLLKRIFQPRAKGKLWWLFIFIMVIALTAFFITFGNYYNRLASQNFLPMVKEVPFRLGLDLLGGTQLTYQANVSGFAATERAAAVEGARDVIEPALIFSELANPWFKLITRLKAITVLLWN